MGGDPKSLPRYRRTCNTCRKSRIKCEPSEGPRKGCRRCTDRHEDCVFGVSDQGGKYRNGQKLGKPSTAPPIVYPWQSSLSSTESEQELVHKSPSFKDMTLTHPYQQPLPPPTNQNLVHSRNSSYQRQQFTPAESPISQSSEYSVNDLTTGQYIPETPPQTACSRNCPNSVFGMIPQMRNTMPPNGTTYDAPPFFDTTMFQQGFKEFEDMAANYSSVFRSAEQLQGTPAGSVQEESQTSYQQNEFAQYLAQEDDFDPYLSMPMPSGPQEGYAFQGPATLHSNHFQRPTQFQQPSQFPDPMNYQSFPHNRDSSSFGP